jgi:surfeit locus 1 family protein
MLALGFWQLDRLRQRRAENAAIAARLDQPPLDLNTIAAGPLPPYTPVEARGVYDFENEIVLRNRTHLDSPGVHVLTPLRLSGSELAVLVDRGWIPYTEAEPALRAAYQTSVGEVSVTGLAQPSQTRAAFFLPGDPTPAPGQARLDAWYWVNLDEIGRQVPYALLPFFVERAASDSTALPVSDTTVDLTDGPHLSYAIQWFAFALILVVGSLALWRQRRRLPRPQP